MSKKLLLSILPLVLGLWACGPRAGNVTFTWTFNGQSCSAAGVNYVIVTIPNETLANNGKYTCAAYPGGVTLLDFAPGNYTYHIEGHDLGGALLYEDAGSFSVNGSRTINVNLPVATGVANAYATFSWSLPAATNGTPPACGTDFTVVDTYIDNAFASAYNCTDSGLLNPTIYVTPGIHTFQIAIWDSTKNVQFAVSSKPTFTATTGVPIDLGILPLVWTSGGAAVPFTINGGACSAATGTTGTGGVDYVVVNFWEQAVANYVFFAAPGEVFQGTPSQMCGTVSPTVYASWPPYSALTDGTYTVYIDAYAAGTPGSSAPCAHYSGSGPVTITGGAFIPTVGATINLTGPTAC